MIKGFFKYLGFAGACGMAYFFYKEKIKKEIRDEDPSFPLKDTKREFDTGEKMTMSTQSVPPKEVSSNTLRPDRIYIFLYKFYFIFLDKDLGGKKENIPGSEPKQNNHTTNQPIKAKI